MRVIVKIWDFFENKIVVNFGIFVLAMVVLFAIEEAFRRYVLGTTFFWYQDAIVYTTLIAIFLYFGIALMEEAHLNVDIFLVLMKGRGGKWKRTAEIVDVVAACCGLAFCMFFVWVGFDLVNAAKQFGRTTESSSIPIWPIYVFLVFGFILFTINFAVVVYRRIKILAGGGK